MSTLFTIGYEGSALDDFIDTLLSAGINEVVDIRAIAQSRRPGFSKSALSAALLRAGIGYRHVRELGDPKEGRNAARMGDIATFRRIFEDHLSTPPAQEALKGLAQAVDERCSVLLCYERDQRQCHRLLVADRVATLTSMTVRHIGVAPKSARKRGQDVWGDARYA